MLYKQHFIRCDTMIKLENVSKYYHTASSVTCALKKVNLEFNVGEFVVITGESGSGKTTLLNIISGLDSYEDGELYIDGKQTSYFDNNDWEKYRKEKIVFIFQNYNLIDSFTVLENVLVPLIIKGYSTKEAKEKAKKILVTVGLDQHINSKATKLSGGQKQKLAIARALAQETKIIVADEPTGNLDVKNGEVIMQLLKEISKDKLVLVVTHNQDEADPYLTRKIRLHDGEIVQDEVRQAPVGPVEESNNPEVEKPKKTNNFKKNVKLSLMNIKSKPKESVFLTLLFTICLLGIFVFLGTFFANLDDSKTKALSDEIFLNHDQTRLLVRKRNGETITAETMKQAQIENVISMEVYDEITDINYYRPSDYEMIYAGGWMDRTDPPIPIFIDSSSIHYTNHNMYMRSYHSISNDDLAAGRLPTGPLEMVVYSEDTSIMDTVETVYFANRMKWNEDTGIKYDVKIVGILKNETEQTYFSDDLCKTLALSKHSLIISIPYAYRDRYWRTGTISLNDIVIDYSVKGYDLVFPKAQYDILRELDQLAPTTNYIIRKGYDVYSQHMPTLNTTRESTIGGLAVAVSEEIFNEVYDNIERTQFAIYISDYAYTDDVISKLADNGFETISCFRASVTGYNQSRLLQRYITLAIAIVGIIVLCILEVVLGYTIYKFNKNVYVIYKIMGLSRKSCKKINLIELVLYWLISTLIVVGVVLIIKVTVTNNLVVDFFKYVRFYHYLIAIAINGLVMYLIKIRYDKLLAKKVQISLLKED